MDNPDITKQLLIQIATNQAEIIASLTELNSDLAKTQAAQKAVSDSSGKASAAYVENASKIRILQQAIRDKNKELDNSARAIVAENNSINQNKALLQVLTAQYNKLAQEEGKTASSTVALGKQIDALSAKLKKQEGDIGNHTRNVGNYNGALATMVSNIGSRYIPGFSMLSGTISTTAQNFGRMGGEAEGAEAGLAGVGAIGAGAAAAFVGVGLALVGLYEYMDQFTGFSDSMASGWAGLKTAAQSALQTIFSGNWSKLFDNMDTAALEAEAMTYALRDLGRQSEVVGVQVQAQNAEIQNLLLKIRDRATSAADSETYFQKLMSITEDQYKITHKLAVDAYNDTVNLKTAKSNLTPAQINSIKLTYQEGDSIEQLSQAYIRAAQNAKKLIDLPGVSGMDKDALKDLTDALNAVQSTDTLKINRDQQAQNRADMKAQRAAEAAEKQLQLQDEIKRSIEEINSEKTASIAKAMQFQMEAYAKELSETDEHYRQMIFKQEQFIEKQQQIIDDPKNNAKTKGLAGQAMGAAKVDIAQIRSEQYQAQEKALIDHNKKMIELVTAYNLEVKSLQDANIENNYKRDAAALTDKFNLEKEALSKEAFDINESINKLQEEINNKNGQFNAEEIVSLKISLDKQYDLLSDNDAKRIALEEDTDKKLKDLRDKFNNDQINNIDQANVDATSSPKGGFSKTSYNAQLQQLTDEQEQATKEADKQTVPGQINTQLLTIHAEFLKKKQDLDEQYNKYWMEQYLDVVKQVSDASFQIISNNIKSETSAKESALQLQTDTELKNTALTTTQKSIIQEQERKKEAQIKRQEFFAQQKLGIAQAIINGAIAEVAALALPPPADIAKEILIGATTALQIGVIAAQQPPPAYATGGYVRGPGTGTSDSIPARLSHGESVMTAKATNMFGPLLSHLNVLGGGVPFATPNFSGRFAAGGFVSGANYLPTAATGLHPDGLGVRLHNDDILGIANAIASMPAPVVDVKDINYRQSAKANVDNRVIL